MEKKICNKDTNLSSRYGHTTVLFNDSLYIYGGKINSKKIKYPPEDILIYNINNNVIKVDTCKN